MLRIYEYYLFCMYFCLHSKCNWKRSLADVFSKILHDFSENNSRKFDFWWLIFKELKTMFEKRSNNRRQTILFKEKSLGVFSSEYILCKFISLWAWNFNWAWTSKFKFFCTLKKLSCWKLCWENSINLNHKWK